MSTSKGRESAGRHKSAQYVKSDKSDKSDKNSVVCLSSAREDRRYIAAQTSMKEHIKNFDWK